MATIDDRDEHAIGRALAENDRLSALCRRRRRMLSVEHSLERLQGIYGDVRGET
ncbi:hypothetical protein [Natronolimnohabitans innermongolicus]|uniref:Group 1 glycosyl transferase n=1 Tax=Natronolimnohabitans innermongolicus JCM 12255 TaxID=1227499 RepID=L9XBB3_9EURY|nr:hypothetical protein [Natronolimnohabitans innermongolicus]ELY58937.1 group 1 glycosyl transferase [Natronolimnohabitans innermongolicus JCM 12255]